MSVTYVVVAKTNPRNPQSPKKYYAHAKSAGETTLRELANSISKRSTLSPVDVMAVLESLLEVVPEEISRGNIVRLGDFGSFSISLNSSGSDKEEDVTTVNITGNSLNFRPGHEVQKVLDTLSYKKIS